MRVCKRWLLPLVLSCILESQISYVQPSVYNEALGLAGSGGGPGGEGADPAGTAQNAGQAGTAGTGIRGDALATPEDVLAHVRDYGGYCRGLESQLATLVRVVSP